MAKKSSIEKLKNKTRLVELKRTKREELKKKASDLSISEEERHSARVALDQMPRSSSPVRLRHRCQMTGRVRGYLRKFKVSRLVFREMALAGMIPGVFKASW